MGKFMPTTGRRRQDSSLYADPLILGREYLMCAHARARPKRVSSASVYGARNSTNRKMRELEGKWQFTIASREDLEIERERDYLSSAIILAMGIIYGHRVVCDFAARYPEHERHREREGSIRWLPNISLLNETSYRTVFSPLRASRVCH